MLGRQGELVAIDVVGDDVAVGVALTVGEIRKERVFGDLCVVVGVGENAAQIVGDEIGTADFQAVQPAPGL